MYRITMTVPVINKGRKVVFLLSGSSKAQVLHDVVAGPYQPEQLPAQLVNPVQGQLYYLLDHGAASKLPAELWQADSSKAS